MTRYSSFSADKKRILSRFSEPAEMMEDIATASAADGELRPAEHRERKAHIWQKDPHDWYVEPSWCSERLFAIEKFSGSIFDPAAGTGRIVEAARRAGYIAEAADIMQRGDFRLDFRYDFLSDDMPTLIYGDAILFDNIVTNPPFRHAKRFVQLALDRAERKVAMLLPTPWIAGDERSRWLANTPLRRVLFLTPRPSMPPGALIQAGFKPGGGREDFAWYIFHRGYDGKPEIGWCRRDT
jgi:hypothetical protein